MENVEDEANILAKTSIVRQKIDEKFINSLVKAGASSEMAREIFFPFINILRNEFESEIVKFAGSNINELNVVVEAYYKMVDFLFDSKIDSNHKRVAVELFEGYIGSTRGYIKNHPEMELLQ